MLRLEEVSSVFLNDRLCNGDGARLIKTEKKKLPVIRPGSDPVTAGVFIQFTCQQEGCARFDAVRFCVDFEFTGSADRVLEQCPLTRSPFRTVDGKTG